MADLNNKYVQRLQRSEQIIIFTSDPIELYRNGRRVFDFDRYFRAPRGVFLVVLRGLFTLEVSQGTCTLQVGFSTIAVFRLKVFLHRNIRLRN